jgi:hypothetical protein
MKNSLLIILLTILSFSVTSRKDKQEELCEGVICENGGECINGDCDCPEGYTGPSCGTQITPSRIRIKNILVTKYPNYDSDGTAFDLGSTPDVYIYIHT